MKNHQGGNATEFENTYTKRSPLGHYFLLPNEIITLVKDTSIARIISMQEIIWAGYAFLKGSHGYSGLLWPLFFTAVYYLIFSGILTVLLGRLEKKLDYFR